jgi:crotonobetainyl-CoA:carnitine CoA-transferase CaiB-like acyl-CoA transferase
MMLGGAKVLEWSEGISAPYSARLLGDLGASVVKVENPAGDPVRTRHPFWPGEDGHEASALFAYLNAGKRSLTLDVTRPDDRERLHGLLDTASILVEN